jgi:hypothetical protein
MTVFLRRSLYYEQKTPLFIQKRGFEYPIKSPSIISKGESKQVTEKLFQSHARSQP